MPDNKPKICVPVFSLGMMREAEASGADIIELRLDSFSREDIDKFLLGAIHSPVPLIATCRPAWEMGKFIEGEGERLEILKAAANIAQFIDVELESGTEFIAEVKDAAIAGGAKLIISEHFVRMPQLAELEKVLAREAAAGADICKIVPTAEKPADDEIIFDVISRARRKNKKIIAIAMGAKGMLSRLLSPFFGAEFTFASLQEGAESAPGQLSLECMREFYGSMGIAKPTPKTQFLFVLGDPVSHSLSPAMMNAAFRKKRMNAVYGKLHASAAQLEQLFSGLRARNFMGANITIPHKGNAMRLCNEVDSAARKIGAVNVVVNRGGKLLGHNTDYVGALEALKEKCKSLAGKRALILGAGGSCRAISFGLKKEGAEICIMNRTLEHAREIAQRIPCSYGRLDSRNLKKELPKADIVINTTSVGLGTHETPVEKFPRAKKLKRKLVVMDIVYLPLKTEMLKRAERAGHEIITGEKMLLHQGAAAFELFTGRRAPLASMRQAIVSRLE